MTYLFEGALHDKKSILIKFSLGLVFWIIQFAYQYYFLVPGQMGTALIRSYALTAATLIGTALLIGPVAKLFPSINYIKHRRAFGVIGFTFAIMHFLSVLYFRNGWDISLILAVKNPYMNPVLFGAMAFIVYIPLYLTSNNWANQKLGYHKWKFIHRFVYIAWIFSVLHFLVMNPHDLLTIPGYLLLAITALVFMLELAAFARHIEKNKGLNVVIVFGIILLAVILFYFEYSQPSFSITSKLIIFYGSIVVVIGAIFSYVISKIVETRSISST